MFSLIVIPDFLDLIKANKLVIKVFYMYCNKKKISLISVKEYQMMVWVLL